MKKKIIISFGRTFRAFYDDPCLCLRISRFLRNGYLSKYGDLKVWSGTDAVIGRNDHQGAFVFLIHENILKR